MMVGGKIAKLEHTIEDVWTRIVDIFATRAVECEFLFGPQNRELEGSPPRIQFERVGGSFQFGGTRSSNGEFATVVQACEARVWGLQSGEDLEKHQALSAFGLVVELIGAIYAVAPLYPDGLTGADIAYANETQVIKYGEQFVVPFQFLAPIKWVTAEEFLAIGGINANLKTRQ
jgi:hypothetical protein